MDDSKYSFLRLVTPVGVLLTLLTVLQQTSALLSTVAAAERRLTTMEVKLDIIERRNRQQFN